MQPPRTAPRSIGAALALVAMGAAAGLLVGRWTAGAGAPDAAPDGPAAGARSRPADAPEKVARDAAMRELARLGYAQAYQAPSETRGGVLLHEPALCAPGLNLVVSAHASEAVLMDMGGRARHRWAMPFERLWPELALRLEEPPTWRFVRLLEGGRLLVIWEPHGIALLERDSTVVWSRAGGYHHALDVAEDGSIWALTRTVHVLEHIHPQMPVLEDFLTRLSPRGEILGELSILEAFERSPHAPLLLDMAPYGDVFHTNAVRVIGRDRPGPAPFLPGRALISLRELDTLALIDLEARRVVWALTGMWRRQHDPRLLDGGRLLVFDNLGRAGKTRILELDPLTQELTWSYGGEAIGGLDSPVCGLSSPLANGNVLVTESVAGRAIEVDRSGREVWIWRSPHLLPDGKVAVLMQVERVPLEEVEDWLPAEDAGSGAR